MRPLKLGGLALRHQATLCISSLSFDPVLSSARCLETTLPSYFEHFSRLPVHSASTTSELSLTISTTSPEALTSLLENSVHNWTDTSPPALPSYFERRRDISSTPTSPLYSVDCGFLALHLDPRPKIWRCHSPKTRNLRSLFHNRHHQGFLKFLLDQQMTRPQRKTLLPHGRERDGLLAPCQQAAERGTHRIFHISPVSSSTVTYS